MSKENLYLGRQGEEEAVDFLRKKGYKIIKRNYKSRLGEIDIIARDKDTLCFVEVKARNSLRFGMPSEAVSDFKQRQISKAALMYLKENNQLDKKARFDVISITHLNEKTEIDLIENAFELNVHFVY